MELDALKDEWRDLWERCPYATPFQSPEWLIPWWHAFRPGRLKCLLLRERGRLAGFAPLYSDETGLLRLAGAGNSDYLDVLVEPGFGVDWIYEQARPAHFQDLRAESPLLRGSPPWAQVVEGEACPVLALPASVEQWKQALPRGIRRNLKRYGEKLGDVRFECSDDPAWIEQLFRLHEARWRKLRDEPGVLANETVVEFHRAVVRGFAERGWLRFWIVHAGGRAAGIVYAFACRGRAYLYLGGFDPALARYGPGTLALGCAIECAIREGLREADFLRGGEKYKFEWGAVSRPNRDVLIRRPCCGPGSHSP